MRSHLFWDKFADISVNQLVRPGQDEPFLIIADPSNDLNLAEALLSAGIRSGADTQLMIKNWYAAGTVSEPGPILSNAILSSKYVLSLCGGIVRAPAMIEARSNGTRLLSTVVEGIEDYVVKALINVDIEAMIANAVIIARLWEETNECRVTSHQGTDVTFKLAPRKSIIGDGALTEDGEVDFYPGAQVSIAPVEESITGTIVIDASDSVQGVVSSPYSFTMVNGIIAEVKGGKEADIMRNWLETRNDDVIYKLCHFSIGLNTQAGISGNMMEDERKLSAIDFGFGYQDPSFGGTVGLSPYHMDIMLVGPDVYLDGKLMSSANKLEDDLGFAPM
jgi:leucyl aminopeptidase (aminopeptidase T)